MTNTSQRAAPLTLPKLAIRLGLSLDLIREKFRTVPELAELSRVAGQARFVEETDLDRVRELLAPYC